MCWTEKRPFAHLGLKGALQYSGAHLPAWTGEYPREDMPSTELCSWPTFREQIHVERIWWKGGRKDARRRRASGYGADCLFATWCKMVPPPFKWLEICICLTPPLNVKLHFGSRHGNSWAAVIQEGVPATCFVQRRRRHSRRFWEFLSSFTPHLHNLNPSPAVIVWLLLFIHFIFFSPSRQIWMCQDNPWSGCAVKAGYFPEICQNQTE